MNNEQGSSLIELIATQMLLFGFTLPVLGGAYYMFYSKVWADHLAYRSAVCRLAHDATDRRCKNLMEDFQKPLFIAATTVSVQMNNSHRKFGPKKAEAQITVRSNFLKKNLTSKIKVSDESYKN